MSDLNVGASADEPEVRRFYSARTAPPQGGSDGTREPYAYEGYTPNEQGGESDNYEYTSGDYVEHVRPRGEGEYTKREYGEPVNAREADYGARVYGDPSYAEPRYEQGEYTPNEEYIEPNYPEPEYDERASDETAYSEPDYDERAYSAPTYARPAYPGQASDRTPYARRDYTSREACDPLGDGRAPAQAQPIDAVAPSAAAKPDYSAYYRAQAPSTELPAQPTYAPPKRLDLRGTVYLSVADGQTDGQPMSSQPTLNIQTAFQPPSAYDPQPEPQGDAQASAQPQANVYRPREATWAETERRGALNAEGYQVRDEEPVHGRKKRHGLRNTLIIVGVLALLGGAAYLFREPLGGLINSVIGAKSTPEPAFAPVTTPAPVRGYDAAPKTEMSEQAKRDIEAIGGSVTLESCAVTAQNVLTRAKRADGLYDFYLFAADGRLLCYFEGLQKLDMTPCENGGFYVRQSPYLVKADGSALMRLEGMEATMGERLTLRQLMNGWAVLADESGGFNYINADGALISSLWFSCAYPFTGDMTAAYVDTGVAGSAERYMLYTLSKDGAMAKWLEAQDMGDVVASACAAAYMSTGELYLLADTASPIVTADEVQFYPDCGVIVARDIATGKYGMYVSGDKHYDYLYDSIKPVECDLKWDEKSYSAEGGTAAVSAVTDSGYPQPLSYYFELQRDGNKEYVALSAVGGTPILLDEQP